MEEARGFIDGNGGGRKEEAGKNGIGHEMDAGKIRKIRIGNVS